MAEGFQLFFNEAVSSTLSGVLGEKASTALLYHLDFPKKSVEPNVLHDKLGIILGSGAGMIENLVVKNLATTLGTRRDESNADFVSSIEKLRGEFTKGRKDT
jgi:hypothetical protein